MSEKKNAILDVAQELFANHGFEGTTTRSISDTAGVNIAMLSYYFGSKEKLLQACLDRYAADIFELIDKIGKEEPDPLKRMKRWNIEYVDFVFNNPQPVIIAARERSLLNDRPEILDNVEKAASRITQYVFNTIEEGKKSGVFREVDTYMTMHTLNKTVESLIAEHVWVKRNLNLEEGKSGKLYPEEFMERTRKHLVDLIETYLCK